jgi:hypothetical protein
VTAALLARVRDAGITISADGAELVVRPASKLTPELRSDLRAAKPQLLALLRSEDADRAPRNLDAAKGADVDGSGGRIKQLQPQRADGGGAIEPSSREELHRRRALARDISAGIAATAGADAIDPAIFDNFDPSDVAERAARLLDAQTTNNQARWEAGRSRHAGADHPSAPTAEAQQLNPPAAPTEPPPPPPPDFDTLVARLAAALATPRPFQRISGDPDRALAYFQRRARHMLSTARGREDQLNIVVCEERLAAKYATNQRNKGDASDA